MSPAIQEIARSFASLAFACLAARADAAPIALAYDDLDEVKTVRTPLTASNPLRMTGLINNTSTGSIVNELSFVAGSSSLALSAGWLIAPPSNRTLGVNIDLLDSSNAVIASDTFINTNGGLARSSLTASGLIAGAAYRLLFTGTAVGAGRYQIDLVDGSVAPPVPDLLPATPASTDHYLFDTHQGTKSGTATLGPDGTLSIDGVLANDGLSAIDDLFRFRLTGGTLSAGIEWIVCLPGDPLRTVGVNVDVLDSFDTVVISDTFRGLIDGQAFSQFSQSGLPNGDYTLHFTGLGANGGGRYRIDLATNATPPAFQPIVTVPPTAVPEPQVLVLLGSGLLAMAWRRRARRSCNGAVPAEVVVER